MRTQNSGFSLLEILTVIGLIAIGSTVAVIQMRQSVATLDADRAMNVVVAQIRYARQIAVDQRRNVDISFTGANEIVVTRHDSGGGTTVMSDETLPGGYTFGLPADVSDTPDAYGNTQPVSFNFDTAGTFLGDGTFVNGAGIVISGTVFTIGSGNGSARAVTLTGASGRLKQYWVQETSWTER